VAEFNMGGPQGTGKRRVGLFSHSLERVTRPRRTPSDDTGNSGVQGRPAQENQAQAIAA